MPGSCSIRTVRVGRVFGFAQFLEDRIFIGDDFVLGREIKPRECLEVAIDMQSLPAGNFLNWTALSSDDATMYWR